MKRGTPSFVTVKPDLDKLVRAIMDSLSSVVWRDDAQVAQVRATKLYDDIGRLGVEITVVELE